MKFSNETMNEMVSSGQDGQVQEYIDLLSSQSFLLEGSKLKAPAAFARPVAKLMTGKGERLASSPGREVLKLHR